MFIRAAFFEGRIVPGREAEFDTFVTDRLVPLWRQFHGATRIDVMREVDAEDGSHRYPMVLQLAYPSREAIDIALASPVRYESRALSQELLKLFEGRVFHVIYRTDSYPPAT